MTAVAFRPAVPGDLPALVALLADDPLGATRDDASLPLDPRYAAAFAAIETDPNQCLLVGVAGEDVVACLQLTFIPGLTRRGMWRGQIEGVRVAAAMRGTGVGHALMTHAIGLCRARGCGLVQLTTDKSRPDAHRFYADLGFVASHEGLKLAL